MTGSERNNMALPESKGQEDRYNGWKNYQTWNVALWINNDEGLYGLSLEYQDYDEFALYLREIGLTETPDKVAYNDHSLDIKALDDLLVDNRGEEE
jgi:hypothetical protein